MVSLPLSSFQIRQRNLTGMHRKIIPIISLFFFCFFTKANAQVSFDLGEVFGPQGSNVCVPLTVTDFVNVGSFQFSLLYDPLLLTPTNWMQHNQTFTLPGFNISNSGIVNMSFAIDFVTPATLMDGDTLLFICFDILGPTGTLAPIIFSDGSMPNTLVPEVGTISGMQIPIGTLDPGSIQTTGTGVFSVTYGSCQTQNIPSPNGSVQVMVTGGVQPYSGTYVEVGNPTNMGNITFLGGNGTTPTNLPPGNYSITIMDSASDTETMIITINVGDPLLLTLANSDPSCAGGNDGSLVLNGNNPANLGGMMPHVITWAPPLTGMGLTQNGLSQGNYIVTVVDANGCVAIETESLIDPPLLMIDSINQTNVSCMGPGNDGSLTIMASGGTLGGGSNYTYSWVGPMAFTASTQNISGLIPGQYCVDVFDDNNCSVQRCFDVTLQVGPVITGFDKINIGCAGDMNGVLTVLFTEGDNPPIDIQWDDPANSITSLISGLGSGVYNVTLTDQAGCSTVGQDSIVAPNPLIFASTTITPPTCPDLMTPNGVIGVTPSGGSGNYTFLWGDGETTATIFGLDCGITYSVTVSDGSSCPPIDTSIFLACPPAIVADFQMVVDVSCDMGLPCDGQATVIASGGTTGSGMYNFIWENGETTNNAGQSTAMFLCQGWNSVTISDQDCFVVDSVLVGAPPPITITAPVINNISCDMGMDGSVTVQAAGGVGNFIYQWQGGPTSQTYDMLGQGVYTVVVTDGNMCTATVDIGFDDPDPIVLDTVPNGYTTGPSCAGLSDGTIELAFTGGNPTGSQTYIWSGNESTSNVANNLAAGTYSITIIDALGCEDSVTISLTEPPPIDFSISNIIPPPCFGEQAVVVVDTATGGSGDPYNYSVGSSVRRPLGQPIMVSAATDLSIKVYDSNNCFAEQFIDIIEPDAIIVEFGTEGIEVDLGASTFLSPFIDPLPTIDSLVWSPTTGMSCIDSTDLPVSCQTVEVAPFDNTVYTLTVFDDMGCSQEASITVVVDKNRKFYIPNAFTPNDDGQNDLFSVFIGPGVEEITSVQVFSRWGEQIVNLPKFVPLSGENIIWNGEFNGKTMNSGVFVYLITARFLDGAEATFRGDVTLIR